MLASRFCGGLALGRAPQGKEDYSVGFPPASVKGWPTNYSSLLRLPPVGRDEKRRRLGPASSNANWESNL